MEQNARKFGVFVATLAMIASLLVIPSASAAEEDLQVSLSGHNGATAYASELGYANFTAEITSALGDAHHNVTVTIDFVDETTGDNTWDSGVATVSKCGEEGTPISNNTGNLDAGSTICVSISVDMDALPGVASTDQGTMEVHVVSDEDTATGSDVEGTIKIVNWMVTSVDGVQAFEESDFESTVCSEKPNCNTYTLTVQNLKLNGERVEDATTEKISIRLQQIGIGWSLNSSYPGWSIMDQEATIDGLDAGQTLDIVFEVTLMGGNIPATSYLAEDSNQIVFETRDDNGFYGSQTLLATVADNFAVDVKLPGSLSNQVVSNGCTDESETVSWSVSINNFGNTYDTFSIYIDPSDAQAASWSVNAVDDDGASVSTPDSTGKLEPKFITAGSSFVFNLEMVVPGGLVAGTTHGFTMTVWSSNVQEEVTSFNASVEQCYDIGLAISQSTAFANPGSLASFEITVTNNGNGEDTVSFTTMGAASWLPKMSANNSTVSNGDLDILTFTLTVPADSDAGAKSGMTMVHAYSEGCSVQTSDCEYEKHVSAQVTTNQIYAIKADYYTNETGIVKSSAEIEEGMMKQMKVSVTNNGNGNDKVTLSLSADAPSWVALTTPTALVGASDTQNVSIDVNAPASGALGEHIFQVIATSQDGTTTSTTSTLTITVVEKGSTTGGSTTETLEDEGGLPGFGVLSAIAAIGAALILRRRL